MDSLLWLFINIPVIFILIFLTLYPFYLRDRNNSKYKEPWKMIGDLLKNRYGAIFIISAFFSEFIMSGFTVYTGKWFIGLIAMLLYWLLIGLFLMWYPFYLKYKSPQKYVGYWKNVGEWLGEPRDAFPIRKKKK